MVPNQFQIGKNPTSHSQLFDRFGIDTSHPSDILIEFRAHLNGGTTPESPYPRDFLSRLVLGRSVPPKRRSICDILTKIQHSFRH